MDTNGQESGTTEGHSVPETTPTPNLPNTREHNVAQEKEIESEKNKESRFSLTLLDTASRPCRHKASRAVQSHSVTLRTPNPSHHCIQSRATQSHALHFLNSEARGKEGTE